MGEGGRTYYIDQGLLKARSVESIGGIYFFSNFNLYQLLNIILNLSARFNPILL